MGTQVGYILLLLFSPVVFDLLFAGMAGIMVFIYLDDMLPAAMGVMGRSLFL